MKTSDMLRNTIIFLLYTLFFVPLFFSASLFFPFISGKGFMFRIVIELVAALYLSLVLIDRSYLPKHSVIAWTVLGFLAVMAAATIFSEYPYRSFWSNYERMEGYITLLHLGVYFVVLGAVLNTKKSWTWFFNASLIMSLVVGARGFMDLQSGITRIYGSLGNSTYLGVYALIHIFLAGFFLIRTLEENKKTDSTFWRRVVLYGAIAIYNGVVMYMTGTRGSLIGLLAGGVVMALILTLFEKEKKYIRTVGMASLAMVIVVIAGLGLLKDSAFAKNHPNLSLERYGSLVTLNIAQVLKDQGYGRTLLWGVAWQGVQERPLLGWGQENFNFVFAKYYDPQLYSQEQWFDRAHNVFLDWLVAGGFLGLLSYLVMFVAFLWYLIRIPKDRLSVGGRAVLAGLVIAYSIHNLFVFDHLVSYLLFFALLAYMHRLAISFSFSGEVSKEDHRPLLVEKNLQYATGAVCIIVCVGVVYVANIRPLRANMALIDALMHQAEYVSKDSGRTGDPKALSDSLVSFEQALSYHSFGTSEAREQLVSASQGAFEPVPEVLKKASSLAVAEMTIQTQESPNDPRYFYFIGGFLAHIRQYDQALVSIRQAEALSPNKQSFQFLEGEALINTKKYDEALAVFKKAYDLAPEYSEAQLFYAVGAIYAGQSELLASLIKKHPNVPGDLRFLQVYVGTKQFSRLIPILADYIKTSPGAIDHRIYLAAAYLEVGQRASALSTLAEAKKVATDPQKLAELDQLIGLINKGTSSLFQ